MQRGNRKATPKVKNGVVQKKNNWELSRDYYDAPEPREVMIDRKRPGDGYRHLLNKSDIDKFLELLPDWDKIAIGLNAIVLAPGDYNTHGYHVPGVVHICAWDTDLWHYTTEAFYEEHKAILERLGVPCEKTEEGEWLSKWDERSARSFQLLHVLLHELGHHHDHMTTKSKRDSGRGEPYAEEYALRYEALIWERFFQVFKW